MIEQGSLVFFNDPKHSWTLGNVVACDGTVATCKSKSNASYVCSNLKYESVFVVSLETLNEDVNDLMSLTRLHEATILNTLRIRYMRDVIYTNIGNMVVALNPFNYSIPIYVDSMMPKYLEEGDRIEKNMPHSWAIAHHAFYEMRNDQKNQCILVSGESGAGKTEATKIVMKYLAAVSCLRGIDSQKAAANLVGQKVFATSPLLEAFGNAKTVRNDNSSRFGKFMRVKFDSRGFLKSTFITRYLLEKSRIVTAQHNERIYHAFYLLVRGKDAERLGVQNEREWRTLGSGGCYNNTEFDTAKAYEEVVQSMRFLGLLDSHVNSVWSLVAGILSLGNVDFVAAGEGSSLVTATARYALHTSNLWKIQNSDLCQELVTTQLTIKGQQTTKLLNPTMAMDCRDALVKALYDTLFAWLVDRCNTYLDVAHEGDLTWIGLLDIFGFENFEVNSFEQVCINLANETLQNHYNAFVFSKDMEECRAEGISVEDIKFPDNRPCLELMTARDGILAVLDEECSLSQGTDENFLLKLEQSKATHPFFEKKRLAKSMFIIKHYAADVSYTVTGFINKNRDTLKDAFKLLLRASGDDLIKTLLPEPIDNARKITVAGYFKTQLQSLMDLINSTKPHWIRCIKPHPAKKPLMFDNVMMMNQLESSGVIATVKIRKAGFPVRMTFADFNSRYSIVMKAAGQRPTDSHMQSAQAQALRKIFQVADGETASRQNKGFKGAVEKFFEKYDPEDTGSIDNDVMGTFLKDLNEPCDAATLKRVLYEVDPNNDGSISPEEFLDAVIIFVNRGYIVSKKTEAKTEAAQDGRETAQMIVKVIGIDAKLVQLGKTRVFLKTEAYIEIETAKKRALVKSAKVVFAFAKCVVEIDVIHNKVMESNKALMEKLRKGALSLIELQKKEAVKREEFFQTQRANLEAAAQEFKDKGNEMLAQLLQKMEEKRIREEKKLLRLEAERAEQVKKQQEIRLADEKRKAEDEQHRNELEQMRAAALKKREQRLLEKVGALAKIAGKAEQKLKEQMQRQAAEEQEKRQAAEERRALVAERRAKHAFEEQLQKEQLVRSLTSKQHEADMKKALTEIRKVREVEKRKMQSQLRHVNALATEQEDKFFEAQRRVRAVEDVRIRQEIIAQAKELQRKNVKVAVHQAFLDREGLRQQQQAKASRVTAKTHSVIGKTAKQSVLLQEKIGKVTTSIRERTMREEAEIHTDAEGVRKYLKDAAQKTEQLLSPDLTTLLSLATRAKPQSVYFDALTMGMEECSPSKAVAPIDSSVHAKLMGRNKYENIVIPRVEVLEEDSMQWK